MSLATLGVKVSQVRCTQKGEMLLEIKDEADEAMKTFREKLREAIGALATVQKSKVHTKVLILSFEKLATGKDIVAAAARDSKLLGLQFIERTFQVAKMQLFILLLLLLLLF